MKAKPIRVLIANDHAIVSNSIKIALKDNPKFKVVGTPCNFAEVFEKLNRLKVDVLVTDDYMCEVKIETALIRIRKQWPGVKIIVNSIHRLSATNRVYRSKTHADGYLHFFDTPEYYMKAIETVYSGGRYFKKRL